MIKTIQYLAEADPSQSLLRWTSKLPSRMSHVQPRCTVSLKLMRISLRSFPSGTPAPRSTECITTQPTPKSVPTVGWIRVVLCQRVDSPQLLTQYFVQSWRSFARITTQAPNSLPTWTIGTCGSNRNASYRQLLVLFTLKPEVDGKDDIRRDNEV